MKNILILIALCLIALFGCSEVQSTIPAPASTPKSAFVYEGDKFTVSVAGTDMDWFVWQSFFPVGNVLGPTDEIPSDGLLHKREGVAGQFYLRVVGHAKVTIPPDGDYIKITESGQIKYNGGRNTP